jgi:cell wall-associated NlpC family hydrolase
MNFEKYIGIPYKNHGRDFNGADCWGLVWMFLSNEMFLDYKNIQEYRDDKDIFTIERHIISNIKEYWEPITIPQQGNIVLFRFRDRLIHMGIVIDRNSFLHTIKGLNSCVERFSSPKWQTRIGGYYGIRTSR